MTLPSLLIAQLSDPHVGTGADFLGGGIDTTAALQRAVQHMASMQPRPDLVLLTGDLVEHGRPEEYRVLAEALAGLPMPVYAVPGNHDDSLVARCLLPGCMPVDDEAPAGRCCFHVEHGGLHLVALDTVVPRKSHGVLGAAQLQWLTRVLDACRGQPTLIFMHHPPLPTGLAVMDACSLMEGGELLEGLIRRHGQVQGLLCGHLHRPVNAVFGGALLHVAPSVAHQIDLDLRADAPLHARLEPPKVSLHRWSPALGLCTHLSYVEPFGEPLPY